MNGGRGVLSLVLHSHIPYVRGTGPWPHGENWLFEAMAESYVPLVMSLRRLDAQHVPLQLTVSLTPVLIEQLADPRLQSGFAAYAGERAQAAEADRKYFERTGQPAMEALAQRHMAFYRQVKDAFETQLAGDLVGAFGALQDHGLIEIATSAATHGYLPLLSEGSVRLQLRTALGAYVRHFGRTPTAIWLPECAYRTGVEGLLERLGLRVFFVETFMVTGGSPAGAADQGRSGGYQVHEAMPDSVHSQVTDAVRSAHRAYRVAESQVAVLGRDARTGSQVWSGDYGYPGDGDYQEFHRQSERSGLRYWRVTDHALGMDQKRVYSPSSAGRQAKAHANHFVGLVQHELTSANAAGEDAPVILAAYDTELFGHWWAEGVVWLEAVLRRVAAARDISLASASNYVAKYPPRESVSVPEGSWGTGGGHHIWRNDGNAWLWPEIGTAEAELQKLAEVGDQTPAKKKLLNQAARELLLLQASDWPFMMTSGQASDFAVERFESHLRRFNECVAALQSESPDGRVADRYWETDSVFPEMDFRWLNP
jgi:1,4-alpha-glucan branching enzyme